MGIWNQEKVLVTGGASFIGSHLVDRLLEAGARVRVADDLSTGSRRHLQPHLDAGAVDLREGDLRDTDFARRSLEGRRVVFHLAADHGGRGYVDRHQAGPASNLLLDGAVFRGALRAGVDKVVYASSGCVYPNHLQADPDETLYLGEDLVRPPYDADNLYGWAKLMGELTLRAYRREHGLASASCRYFTVYGPRGVENHAILAMVARAFARQDPFEVWGDGQQVRNWTYVDDIVRGTLLAAERIDDGAPVNLGTTERIRVLDAVRQVVDYAGYRPEIRLRPEMPTGPRNRVADNARAAERLGWRPEVLFADGLRRTMDWYFADRDPQRVKDLLETELTDRIHPSTAPPAADSRAG
ncbi:MAG: NAD-dependent epimerase/dehydratase family protein [Acidobacteriota bacterium]